MGPHLTACHAFLLWVILILTHSLNVALMGGQVSISFANGALSIAAHVVWGTMIATALYLGVQLVHFATLQALLEGVADGFSGTVPTL